MHQSIYSSFLIVLILVIIILWLFSKIPMIMTIMIIAIIYGVFTTCQAQFYELIHLILTTLWDEEIKAQWDCVTYPWSHRYFGRCQDLNTRSLAVELLFLTATLQDLPCFQILTIEKAQVNSNLVVFLSVISFLLAFFQFWVQIFALPLGDTLK